MFDTGLTTKKKKNKTTPTELPVGQSCVRKCDANKSRLQQVPGRTTVSSAPRDCDFQRGVWTHRSSHGTSTTALRFECSGMPRSATDRDGSGQSYRRSYSSEEMDRAAAEYHPVSPARTAAAGEGDGGRPSATRWPAVVLSVLGSAVAVAAVGCFCALIYPILKELRAERVRGQDGTEERMLGFLSILVLSVLVGCISCVFSWTLTYLNSNQPGTVVPTLTLAHFRDVSGHGFHLGYGVAVLNGIMALLTVIWSLT